jgi:hypothetical protein
MLSRHSPAIPFQQSLLEHRARDHHSDHQGTTSNPYQDAAAASREIQHRDRITWDGDEQGVCHALFALGLREYRRRGAVLPEHQHRRQEPRDLGLRQRC